MKYKIVLILICQVFFFYTHSQNGYYLVENYNLEGRFFNTVANGISQDAPGKMLFSTAKGILIYDGVEWSLLQTGVSIEDITGSDPIVVRNKRSVGIVSKNEYNEYVYKSLATDSLVQPQNIEIIADTLFIQYKRKIVAYLVNTKEKLHEWSLPDSSADIGNIFAVGNKLFCFVAGKGILKTLGNSIVPLGISALQASELSCISKGNKKVFIGTASGRLYTFNGNAVKGLPNECEDIFVNAHPKVILKLPGNTIAVATSNIGILFLNKETGELLYRLDKNTGLPSNTIFDMFVDKTGDLWVSHKRGISKVQVSLPARGYNIYPGLRGELQTVFVKDSTVYVGTTNGIFQLIKTTGVSNINSQSLIQTDDFIIQNNEHTKTLKAIVHTSLLNSDDFEGVQKQIPVTFNISIDTLIQAGVSATQLLHEKTLVEEYISSVYPWHYKRVKNVSGSCIQFVSHGDDTFAATSEGIYKIENNIGTRISEIQGIVQMLVKDSILFALTYSKVTALDIVNKKKLSQVTVFPGTNSFSNEDTVLWVGGLGKIAFIQFTNTGILSEPILYNLPMDIPVDVFIMYLNEPLFFCGDEIYGYDTGKDSIVQTGSLPILCNVESKIISKQQGFAWTQGCSGWRNLGSYNPGNLIQRYLSLFDNIKDIFVDSGNRIWIINDTGIFQLNKKNEHIKTSSYEVVVASFKDKLNNNYASDNFSIPMTANAIQFTLAAHTYFKESKTLYRYKMAGLTDNWSKWSTTNHYAIPFIPGGDYILLVEAKNAIGKVVASKPISFSIPEYYLKAWWFYLILGIVLIAVLLIVYTYYIKQLREERDLLLDKISELETNSE